MPRSTTAAARRQLAHLLDSAERGEEVIIERRGVRFNLVAEPDMTPYGKPSSPLQILDPALLDGDWSWEPDECGQLQLSTDKKSP